MINEGSIPKDALDYLTGKGLNPAWSWSTLYGAEHNHMFTVAKVMELDLLETLYKHTTDALKTGETFHSYKKDLLNKLGKSGWGKYEEIDKSTGEVISRLSDYRLKKIYNTNLNQARHAGAWAEIERSKDTLPYLQYKTGPSVKHRVDHASWEGIVLPVDDPWWDTHSPMNGWGCKCWVQQITQKKAEEKGISKAPKITTHDWVNKATGRTHKVPKGIDPSFDYNPGKARQAKILEHAVNKFNQASPAMAQSSVAKMVSSPQFENWFKKPEGNYPVAVLDESITKVIGTSTQVAVLSPDTMVKQIKHHPELSVDEYRSLTRLSSVEIIIAESDTHLLFIYKDNRWYRAVVKATASGEEMYVLSLSRIKDQAAKKAADNPNRIKIEE